MEQRTAYHAAALTATQTPDNAAAVELLGRITDLLARGGVWDSLLQPGSLHFLGRVLAAQANTLGFKDGFMIIVVVFVLALIPAMMLGRTPKNP